MLLIYLLHFRLLDHKHAGEIKTKPNIAPFVNRIGDKSFFIHALGIAEMKLEYVTAGLNVDTNR